LKANRADGCRWTNVSEPSTAVEQVGAPEYQADNGEGTYVFHFKTRGAGDADIRLAYQRPDDGRRPPLRTFEMKVMVGTMGRIAEH
jgi:predicted secreted protein